MRYIIIFLLGITIATGQTTQIYDIPFTSKGNVIELSISNTSSNTAEGVKVAVINAPIWLKFESKTDTLQVLKANEEQTAEFVFSVEKTAEVNKEQKLSFTITDKTGQIWTKDITIKITPPATYELFQNYPNPFNPTTTICYQLSANSNVSLKIYDIRGREVENLINEQQEAGYHQTTLDANRLASGVYFYKLLATDEKNGKHIFQKKMVMMK